METVNSITSAISKAVLGDTQGPKPDPNNTEPVSGELGNVKAGEPYDKGNMEPPVVPSTDGTSDYKPSTAANTTNDIPGLKNTSTDAKPVEHQGAGVPTQEPNSEEHERIVETKKEIEEAAKTATTGSDSKSTEEKVGEPSVGLTGTGVHGSDGAHEGTGELYVKSSGVKAEGGDFDAKSPGAGKEADRLLEEQGVSRSHKPVTEETTKTTGEESKAAPSTPGKEKLSLKEKIKAKLHKNKDKE